MWTAFTWLMTILSVTGTCLVIRQKRQGFYWWTASNLGWVVVDFGASVPAQAALYMIYLGLSIYGIWEWKREPKG